MNIKSLTSVIAGAGMLALTAPAFATVIDNINLPSPGPHTLSGTVSENIVTTPGTELTGSGLVNSIDGSASLPCGSGSCSLNYNFGGFILDHISTALDGVQTAFFTGGHVNFLANGSNPFLSLTADPEVNQPNSSSQYTLIGTLASTNGTTQNSARGLLSVNSGDAASFFDTNGFANGSNGSSVLSDLLFNVSLSPQSSTVFMGSADAHYVAAVPEPGALAMFGLGLMLVGFGVNYRRRGFGNMG